MDCFNGRWEWLMILASGIAIALGLLVWFFLIPHPDQLGITIE